MAVSFFQAAENLAAFALLAGDSGAPMAAARMAECGRDADKAQLTLTSHAMYTESPAPAPESPSYITGALHDAQVAGDPFPLAPTLWEAQAGPDSSAASDNGPYGRFLQFGGVHVAHNASGEMHWFEEGIWHHAEVLDKMERPYLTYALDEITGDGSLHEAAVEGFEAGMGW